MTGFLVPAAPVQFAPAIDVGSLDLPPLTILVPIINEPASALRRSLASLLELDYPQDRLTVRWLIDRGLRRDLDTLEVVRTEFGTLVPKHWAAMVLDSTVPRGRAVNDGIRRVDTDWIGLLDCDCVLHSATARAALSLLVRGDADFIEALEYQELEGLRTRVFTAQNVAYLASLSFMQRRLGWHFLAFSSVFFNKALLARVGPYPEDDAEEGHAWSIPAAAANVRALWIPYVSWGVASSSLRKVLLQRSVWLRGQLNASRLAFRPGLPARVRIGVVAGAVSILLEGVWPFVVVLAIWWDAMRWLGAVFLVAEYARAIGAARSGCAPSRLGIGWVLLPAFEALVGLMVWKALRDLLFGKRPRYSLREPENPAPAIRDP